MKTPLLAPLNYGSFRQMSVLLLSTMALLVPLSSASADMQISTMGVLPYINLSVHNAVPVSTYEYDVFQTFTTGNNIYSLDSVSLNASYITSLEPTTFLMQIFAVDANFLPTGAALGNLVTPSIPENPTFADVTFLASGLITLQPSTNYALVLGPSSPGLDLLGFNVTLSSGGYSYQAPGWEFRAFGESRNSGPWTAIPGVNIINGISATVIPEPASFLLFAPLAGLCVIAFKSRRVQQPA